VAYETVETDNRQLPLLAPMSEIAGRLAAQAGAYFLEKPLGGRARVVMSSAAQIEAELERADVVIGAVLIPGAAAPKLVTRAMLPLLPPRAVLVDVAIDQGGCFETSRPTTHAEPTYEVDGVLHYCVANMPGAVPRTSTMALTNATLPYVRRIAELGLDGAIDADPGLAPGVNVRAGELLLTAVTA
jgi:alanine dehydrogenase